MVCTDFSGKLHAWFTASFFPNTKAQYALVLTAGLAQETLTMRNIWNRCFSLSAEPCHHAVVSSVIKGAIELYAFSKITGWYKRDDTTNNALVNIDIGGARGFIIPVSG